MVRRMIRRHSLDNVRGGDISETDNLSVRFGKIMTDRERRILKAFLVYATVVIIIIIIQMIQTYYYKGLAGR